MRFFKLPNFQYQREFEAIRWLRHPRIVAYYAYFETPDSYNLAMEFVPNGSLKNMITIHRTRGCPFKLQTVLKFLVNLIQGVEYLHANGIIHGDLATCNVVFDEEYELKIADFGYARFLNEPSEGQWLKEALGMGHCNCYFEKHDDVFGLGCILYELCSLDLPYTATTYELPDTYPNALNKLCEKMTKRNPTKRITIDGIIKHSLINQIYKSSKI